MKNSREPKQIDTKNQGSSWQLTVLLAVIALCVLMLAAKVAGIF